MVIYTELDIFAFISLLSAHPRQVRGAEIHAFDEATYVLARAANGLLEQMDEVGRAEFAERD